MAALEFLKANNPTLVDGVTATAGLSLGEYTALVFAGVMSFEDGLRLVQRRGEAMQAAADKVPSGMVSILGLTIPQIEELCVQARGDGEVLQIANLLCPGNTVVSGHKTACAKVAELATAGAMKTIPLAVAGVPYATDATCRRATGNGVGFGFDEVASHSGCFERGCRNALRSGRDSRLAAEAASFAGPLGRFTAMAAGPRAYALLGSGTRTRAAWPAEAH
ncbi:MAG: hypothetical protein U0894_02375 [Pirellulales bacterium]